MTFVPQILKGTTFSLSGTRTPNLTGITTTALVRFWDNTTASLTVTVVDSAAGTYTISSSTSTWVVGTISIEITYQNSTGGSETRKFYMNCVDPSCTATQTSFVDSNTKIIVNQR